MQLKTRKTYKAIVILPGVFKQNRHPAFAANRRPYPYYAKADREDIILFKQCVERPAKIARTANYHSCRFLISS